MPFVAERGVAALGSDGNSDTAPSTTEGVAFPIHVLALNAMGVHLLDYLQFEDLRVVCERTNRWGVPGRGRAAAHPGRHRVAAQPHRDLLSKARGGRGGDAPRRADVTRARRQCRRRDP